MTGERFDDESVKEVSDQIGRDRVHPHDSEDEGPAALVPNVHDEIKRGEEQETPTAGRENPTRGPNALHDRADSSYAEQPAGSEADHTGNGKPAHLFKTGAGTAQDLAC